MQRDKMEFPGLFIVFEGIDGSGKSTQLKKLLKYLQDKSYTVVSFYQPTHGQWGQKLREFLTKGHIVPIQDEINYSIKDRKENVDEYILPALKENKIVLLDRYYWSNAAYQGIADVSYKYILEKNTEFPEPDIKIYFDIKVEIANKRILDKRKETPNQFESIKNLIKSKKIFDKIINDRNYNGILITVEAEKDQESIFNSILEKIRPYIPNENLT